MRLGAGRWHLEHATTIAVGPGRLRVDSTSLRSVLGATLSVSADLPDDGPIRGTLAMRGFTASELAFFNLISAEVGGRVSADVSITGTRSAPRMTGRAQFDSASVNGRAAPSLSLAATYADRRLQAEAHGTFNTREVLAVRGSLPLDLRLRSVATRKVDDSLSVTVRADSATLDGLEAVVPGVEGLRGTVTANVDIRGSWNSVQPLGTVRLRGGAFTLPQMGFVAQDIVMDDTLARDTVNIHARMTDGNGPRNSFAIDGAAWLADGKWRTDITSVGRGFRVADDPRFATADANWLVHFTGLASEPSLEGDLALFNTSLVLGAQRKVRTLRSDSAGGAATESVRKAHISSLRVFLGTNVRLKSRDANVGLSGDLELSGPMTHPYVTGEVYAERGTYRVNLGVLKRTFRVDSGSVLVAGTFNVAQATIDPPATLDIWTSYVVRRSEQDDITVRAHLTGTPDAPRLALASSDLGTSVAQSEIISYLIFGTPSFGVDQLADRAANTALVPYVGGLLEGVLGTLFPFFSSLQVATIQGNNLKGLTTSPVDGLLNSFALSAGRQMGSDSFLNLSGGVCRGSRLASTTSPPGWFSVSAEYRPKRGPSGVVSVEPSASPCSGLSRYQFGLDIFRDWRF